MASGPPPPLAERIARGTNGPVDFHWTRVTTQMHTADSTALRHLRGGETARRILIIGSGDPECREHGLGRRLVESVDEFRLPFVDTHGALQLTAEDAAIIADYDVVIFVDSGPEEGRPFDWRAIAPAARSRLPTRPPTPETLLSMAWRYLEARPEAYRLSIGGDGASGSRTGLSPAAETSLAAALSFVREFLTQRQPR